METIRHYWYFLPFGVVLTKGETDEAYEQACENARKLGYEPIGKGYFKKTKL